MSTGTIVKNARQRVGMTLTELAEMVGSSSSSLSMLENNQHKYPPSPGELVEISDALHDTQMLQEYCGGCPVRKRIIIRKFPPLNNILPGAHVSAMKTGQKLAEAAEMVQTMLTKMLKKDFHLDPEYLEYRDQTIIKIIDAKRGAETLLGKMQQEGFVSSGELRMLASVQQQMCIEKGHHIEEG